MQDKLRAAFDQVQAGEEIQRKTQAFVARKTRGYTRISPVPRLVLAAACLLAVLVGGWLYFTPTAEINIALDQAVTLGINRFDQVVSVDSPGGDTLSLQFSSYTSAVEKILATGEAAGQLAEADGLAITVVGGGQSQSARLLAGLEQCTASQGNAYCYAAQPEELAAAQELGLPYGKYQAYLAIQAYVPQITPEEIQAMTMREIRDWLADLSGDESGQGNGSQGNASGNPWGAGGGNGQGNGQG